MKLAGEKNIIHYAAISIRQDLLHRINLNRLISLLSFFIILSFNDLHAQSNETVDSAEIHFPQSKWQLNPSFGNNSGELDRILHFMNCHNGNDSTYTLRKIRVVGSASPEGSISINEMLSRKRANSLFDYLYKKAAISDSVATFEFLGRDWKGLRKLVEFDTRVPYRRDVMELIDEIIAAGKSDNKASNMGLARLRALHNGVPYKYLYEYEFPRLRASKMFVEYDRKPMPVVSVTTDTIKEILKIDSILIEENPVEEKVDLVGLVPECGCKPFYMDIRSNMLYDVLAVPSIGVEFYLGKNWSIGANWMYGWWDKNKSHRYWRAYGGDINVRRWFGKRAKEKPLTGHHLGLYAGVVTYDFEFGGKGIMGGLPHQTLWKRCNYMGGIEYGYSFPVAKRINIDITIGIGYLGGKYIKYEPEDGHYVWKETRKLNWFGPTKAEVSFVWLIGCDNYNRSKKGGNL